MMNEGDETAYYDVGTHQLFLKKPNIAQIIWKGTSTPQDLCALYDRAGEFLGKDTRFYVIMDVSGLTATGPEARKYAATEPRVELLLAIAYVGASFQMRVLMTMVYKGIRVIRKQKTFAIAFFDTLKEAHQWIEADSQRQNPT